MTQCYTNSLLPGHAIAQVTSHWLLTTVTQIQPQESPHVVVEKGKTFNQNLRFELGDMFFQSADNYLQWMQNN